MSIIQPPTIPAGPTTPPQRSNPDAFSAAFEAFLVWFIGNFLLIVAAINSAYQNALDALNSANIATNAAAAALVAANVTPWVSGTTYQQYVNVISPVNGRTYRRITAAGSGTIDPSLDSTNYVQLSANPGGAEILASYTVSTPLASISFLNLFTAAYDKYVIEVEGLTVSALATLTYRLAASGVVDANTRYMVSGDTAPTSTGPNVTGNAAVATTGPLNSTITITNANGTGNKAVQYESSFFTTGGFIFYNAGTLYTGATAVSGIQLNTTTTFTAGIVRVYGIRNA